MARESEEKPAKEAGSERRGRRRRLVERGEDGEGDESERLRREN